MADEWIDALPEMETEAVFFIFPAVFSRFSSFVSRQVPELPQSSELKLFYAALPVGTET